MKKAKSAKWSLVDMDYYWALRDNESSEFLPRKFYFNIKNSDEKNSAQIAAGHYMAGFADAMRIAREE